MQYLPTLVLWGVFLGRQWAAYIPVPWSVWVGNGSSLWSCRAAGRRAQPDAGLAGVARGNAHGRWRAGGAVGGTRSTIERCAANEP